MLSWEKFLPLSKLALLVFKCYLLMNNQSLHLMTSNVLLPPMISAFVPFKKSVFTPGYESPFLHFFLIRPIIWLEINLHVMWSRASWLFVYCYPHSCSVGLATFIVSFPHKIAVNQWPCIHRSTSDHCSVCWLIFLSLWEYHVELAVRFVKFSSKLYYLEIAAIRFPAQLFSRWPWLSCVFCTFYWFLIV